MGKLVGYISMLIFIDMFFLATGQLCGTGTCSLSTILLNAIINLGTLNGTAFFSELIGGFFSLFSSKTGFAALIATGGVLVGSILAVRNITILFIPLAFTFALLAGDFVLIFIYLLSFSPVLATFIMAPLTIIYILTVVEWLRLKD